MKSTRKIVPHLNLQSSCSSSGTTYEGEWFDDIPASGSDGYVRVINIKGTLGQWYILKHLGLGMITLAVLCCSTLANELDRKPNILFIFSDDLSYRDLSSYGQEQFRTPNLDKLAMNGIRFTQAI